MPEPFCQCRMGHDYPKQTPTANLVLSYSSFLLGCKMEGDLELPTHMEEDLELGASLTHPLSAGQSQSLCPFPPLWTGPASPSITTMRVYSLGESQPMLLWLKPMRS